MMEGREASSDRPARPPAAVFALGALWAVVELIEIIDSRRPAMWPNQQPSGFAFAMGDALSYLYRYLFIAVIVFGLIKGLRFVWVAALAWQAIEAGFGLVNLTLNDYELGAFRYFSGVPFNGIVLPLTAAALSFLLLLLPSVRRWLRSP